MKLRRAAAIAALLTAAAPAVAEAATRPAIDGSTNDFHVAWLQSDSRYSLVQSRKVSFGAPVTQAEYISPAGRLALDPPEVGGDGLGNTVLAWLDFDGASWRVLARRRAYDGTLSPVRTVAGPQPDQPKLDMDVAANGSAVIAWTTVSGPAKLVQARRRALDGTLSTVQTVSQTTGTSDSPRVGLDQAGNALIAWSRSAAGRTSRSLQLRRRAVDGTLGTTQALAATTVERGFDLAVAPGGQAVAAWQYPTGEATLVLGRARAADGALSSIQTLSPTGATNLHPRAAINPDGRAVFGWVRSSGGEQVFEGRVRAPGGGLGNRFTIETGDRLFAPDVAIDENGAATFVSLSDGAVAEGPLGVRIRRRTAAGVMSSTQELSAEGASGLEEPVLALNNAGRATVAWTQRMSDQEAYEVVVRERRTDGTLSAISRVSE